MKEKTAFAVILGGGPGGYTAAFRAADLLKNTEKKVVLIEQDPYLGGVCLHQGCIPSKSLLHLASLKKHLALLQKSGLNIAPSNLGWDLTALQSYQQGSIQPLSQGLSALAKARGIEVVQGYAHLTSPFSLEVHDLQIHFEKLIVATGSQPRRLFNQDRIWTAQDALKLQTIPPHLVIIGGGVIAVEMAQIYQALGSKITILESAEDILMGTDLDLKKVLKQNLEKEAITIHTQIQIQNLNFEDSKFILDVQKNHEPLQIVCDQVLEAVGRVPHGDFCKEGAVSLQKNHQGFIHINPQTLETNHAHILAIGDCTGGQLLAHKAIAQGKIAAERICGHSALFSPYAIASVVYTDPEYAWVGPSESELVSMQQPYKKALFPWKASGRALATRQSEGLTKVLYDPTTHRVISGGLCGAHAGDLIGELCLAVEMGAFLEDIALTIHPHPSTVETIPAACEVALGSITDLIPKNTP